MVSVIVPVYNAEKYIERCLKSILNQTCTNLEIVVVINGSTDTSLEICKKISNKKNNVHVYEIDEANVSVARNYGIAKAKGKYVTFVDADDYVNVDMYEKMLENVNDYDLVICGINIVEIEKQKVIRMLTIKEEKKILNKKDFFSLWFDEVLNSPVNKLYKRELILKNKIEFNRTNRIAEDLIFNLNYIAKIEFPICVIKYCGYMYLQNPESAIHKRYENIYQQMRNVEKAFEQTIKEIGISKENEFDIKKIYLLNRLYAFEHLRNIYNVKQANLMITQYYIDDNFDQLINDLFVEKRLRKGEYYLLKNRLFGCYFGLRKLWKMYRKMIEIV